MNERFHQMPFIPVTTMNYQEWRYNDEPTMIDTADIERVFLLGGKGGTTTIQVYVNDDIGSIGIPVGETPLRLKLLEARASGSEGLELLEMQDYVETLERIYPSLGAVQMEHAVDLFRKRNDPKTQYLDGPAWATNSVGNNRPNWRN
jgi:hypothetical protein